MKTEKRQVSTLMATPTAATTSSSASTSVVEELLKREVPDWDDEVISTARFKAFSGQRSDWEPRFVFWRDLIIKVARGLGICIIKSSEVKNVWFARGGLTPLCIDRVLLEMYDNGELLLKGDLMDPTSGQLYQIIRRFQRMLGISKSSALRDDGCDVLILRTMLEERADNILKHLAEKNWNANCIITMEYFHEICKIPGEASAILSYLYQCGKAQYFSVRKTDIIEGLKISLVPANVTSICSLDYNVLQLNWTSERLHQQLTAIDCRWMVSRKSAIASLKSGNRQAAYRHVQQSKLLNENRKKCSLLLDRVEEVISLIHDAESTKKVSEAIQIGSQAMKENKLSMEEIHQHLQELDDAAFYQKQVNEALDSATIQSVEIEENIEDEFLKLEMELVEEKTGTQTTKTKIPAHERETTAVVEEDNHEEPTELLSQSLSKLNLEAV